MFIDPETSEDLKRSIFNAIVAPRPIGWISSISSGGQVNLAPFSHFNIVSTAPAVLIFSCNSPEDRVEKDTLANVRATGEFVFNLVSYDLRDAMNLTSTAAPHGIDEFELAGLEKAASVKVRPPRVAARPPTSNVACCVSSRSCRKPKARRRATWCSAAWSACTCKASISTLPDASTQ